MWRLSAALVSLNLMTGCLPAGQRARLLRTNENLRTQVERLERSVAQREETIARLHRQVETLQGFEPDRPADLFAPVRIEIVSPSGGAQYDDLPGDDGITIYLRPRDRDGHAVKAPGKITVQLLDNSDLSAPRSIGLYTFSKPKQLRESWYGILGQHYTLKCPFPPDVDLPVDRKLTVSVQFTDYLTGVTLTATKELTFRRGAKTAPRHASP